MIEELYFYFCINHVQTKQNPKKHEILLKKDKKIIE